MIEFKQMTMEESDLMLKWKNYPETRKFSIKTHKRIKKSDHEKWLKDHLGGLFLIVVDNENCGALRVNKGEISIWIDKKYQGIGLATKAIKEVMWPRAKAKIVDGNIPSMRAFINAGFKPVSYQKGYYIFKI